MFLVLEEADEDPEDVQKTFDLISSAEKELFWIENTTNAWAVRGNHRHRQTRGMKLIRGTFL
jgi:hypothetical protein